MRVVVRSVSWVLAVAAVVAAAASWLTVTPELDAADAADVAVGALEAAGHDAEVDEPPTLGVHETEDGKTVDAWIVFADVEVDGTTETVELRVRESGGELAYLDDRIGPDRRSRLLDDREFERLSRYEDDSTTDEWILQNSLGSAGAVAIAATAVVLARRIDTVWSDHR